MNTINLFDLVRDFSKINFEINELIGVLDQFGVVVLRNIFDQDLLDKFISEAENALKYPAVAGSFGYYKKDFPKKFVDPFTLYSGSKICLDERIIEVVEAYMESDCILSEANIKLDKPIGYTYFPLHSDYCPGIKRSADLKEITKEDMKSRLAVGAAMYLRDTTEGAFSYCLGSHKLQAHKGANLPCYTTEEQTSILSTWMRIDGKKGDIVIFDDRGFHGPAQPSSHERVVMLMDWFNVNVWGGKVQMVPFRIYSSSIAELSKKQMDVLGVGAKVYGNRDTYHIHAFGKNYPALYKLNIKIIESAGLMRHWKKLLKVKIEAIIRRFI